MFPNVSVPVYVYLQQKVQQVVDKKELGLKELNHTGNTLRIRINHKGTASYKNIILYINNTFPIDKNSCADYLSKSGPARDVMTSPSVCLLSERGGGAGGGGGR